MHDIINNNIFIRLCLCVCVTVCVLMQDCLPVSLMFDLKDEGDSDPRKLAQMMQNLGVFISVKPKVKQTAKVLQHSTHNAPVKKRYAYKYEIHILILQTKITSTYFRVLIQQAFLWAFTLLNLKS